MAPRPQWFRPLAASLLFLLCSAVAAPCPAGDTLFQYSTIDALLAGIYDGDLTMEELKYQGDFGLGTLNGLDGELVVLDGVGYHVTAGGHADVPDDTTLLPFAVAAYFEEDSALKIGRIKDLEELNAVVLAALPTRNIFYAIRIDGRFHSVKTRAIPRQTKPYAPLAQAAKEQVVVSFTGDGTLIGFYSPSFAKGINVPGFHWHFLTGDRTGGGHVLDCSLQPATAHIDELRSLTIRLPESGPFDSLDLTGDKGKELQAVEKDPAPKN